MKNENDQALSDVQMLVDSTTITVEWKPDPSGPLVKGEIEVHKIPVRKLDKLGLAWGNEPQEIALYTGKDVAWVESLTDESFERVIEEGRRINFTSFEKWFRRQTQTLKALGQGNLVDKVIEDAIKKVSVPLAALPK